MEGKTQAMDMKERKGMAKDILLGDLPDMDNILCVLNKVPLCEGGSFGLTRRPGGINKKGRVMILCVPIRNLRRIFRKQLLLREGSLRIDGKNGSLSIDRSHQSLPFF